MREIEKDKKMARETEMTEMERDKWGLGETDGEREKETEIEKDVERESEIEKQ